MNKINKTILILLLMSLASISYVSAESDNSIAADEQALRQSIERWTNAFSSEDIEQLLKLYTPNAIVLPPSLPVLKGLSEIEADFNAYFSDYEVDKAITIVSLDLYGNIGVESSTYEIIATPMDGSEGFTESGKHLVVREKVKGEWLIVNETWNVNTL